MRFFMSGTASSFAAKAGLKVLAGHVPKVTTKLSAQGPLPSTNELHLAIGLTLHDEQGLADLLDQIYDPSSTNFHRYLSAAGVHATFRSHGSGLSGRERFREDEWIDGQSRTWKPVVARRRRAGPSKMSAPYRRVTTLG